MNTPRLDEKIEELEMYQSADELSNKGKETLIEFKAIKQALNIDSVVGQSEQFYCQTEHEKGGGRCPKCCNPEGECFFKKQ
jgi:hypothetical protein